MQKITVQKPNLLNTKQHMFLIDKLVKFVNEEMNSKTALEQNPNCKLLYFLELNRIDITFKLVDLQIFVWYIMLYLLKRITFNRNNQDILIY